MRWPQTKCRYSQEERAEILRKAHYNLFYVPSEAVFIDLLTDSGTGKMSPAQWRALQNGDESYAGSTSARKLKDTIRQLFGVPYVLLAHQGRAAENVFCNVMLARPGLFIAGNTPFDTTRIHIESRGARIVDCTLHTPLAPLKTFDDYPRFAGNLDLGKLHDTLKSTAKDSGRRFAFVLITATCNSNAGQPVSLGNLSDACIIAKYHGVPVFLDLARYAENAFFIKTYDGVHSHLSVSEIVKRMMKFADGFLASGKKDALGNMGGFIGLKDPVLARNIASQVIKNEGLDLSCGDDVGGYGGMSGRDMEALNRGMLESTDEKYLARRVAQVRWLAKKLFEIGIPVLPPGGHAVFVDAGAFLPHLRWDQFPGHALALALYLEGGIRAVEIGSLMLGRDPQTGENRQAPQELTRLAIPRRLYTNKQLEHVVRVFEIVKEKANRIPPVDISEEREPRHFHSAFRWNYI